MPKQTQPLRVQVPREGVSALAEISARLTLLPALIENGRSSALTEVQTIQDLLEGVRNAVAADRTTAEVVAPEPNFEPRNGRKPQPAGAAS